MARFIWDDDKGAFVDADDFYSTKAWERARKVSSFPTPFVAGDIAEYVSPVTGKPVSGRAARREDLKRSGCREVDPSEYTPKYESAKYERRYSKRARQLAQSK